MILVLKIIARDHLLLFANNIRDRMRSLYCTLGFFIVTVFVSLYFASKEGFIGDPNAQQCGVDKPPCPFRTACMNGYCVGTNPPALPTSTGLPVIPLAPNNVI